MSASTPWAALFLLLVPILIIFYLLKVRRQNQTVASTFLWRQLTRDMTAHEPWQRLRWNPLLLLQALLMLALIFALIRPYLRLPGNAGSFEVIVLDGSASMMATDVSPSRFAAAVAAARTIVSRLPPDAKAAVIETGFTPRTLAAPTADRSQLDQVLANATPSISLASMRQALELALALTNGQTGSRIDVLTGGGFPSLADLSDVGVPIHFTIVAGRAQNEGITELSARPDPLNPSQYSLFAQVTNFGTQPSPNTVSFTVDGRVISTQDVTAAPGTSQEFVLDSVPATAHLVEAKLSATDDLALDNRAVLELNQRPPARVLMVTAGNVFWLTALKLLNVQLFTVTPNDYASINPDNYDVVILDSYLPPILPQANLLLINPPDSPLIHVRGTSSTQTVASQVVNDPLLQYVDLHDLAVRQAELLTPPDWLKPLVAGSSSPLLLAGTDHTRIVVVMPFATQDSNVSLLPTFPILAANVIDVLQPTGGNSLVSASSGGLIVVPLAKQTDTLTVQRPDGSAFSVSHPSGASYVFDGAQATGPYTITQQSQGQTVQQEVFAVNLLNAQESDLKPVALNDLGPSSAAAGAQLAAPNVAPYELWPFLAGAAGVLLMLEWWWYHRRV